MPHVIKTPYTVDVFDLMHRPGEMREKTIDVTVPEDFGNAMIGVKTGSLLHLDLRMESLHDGILVSADVDATAAGECGRCLIDIEQPVQVEFQELFAYSSDEAFEYEVHEDTIDLEPVIRDAVVLSLPFQPVCQEDCLGLCPICGVRLLDNPGHEHEAPIDSRWAALGNLAGLDEFASTDEAETTQDVTDAQSGIDREKR
ncbi:MAG TPA: YceD family protein [Lacisediminihabitans sp.]|uniref:YceD family protein n=1 Tax=Lacisediminihabitans sp. TaxID=2787631 RepID=UPI002ED87598